jgi:hypothetical protein
LFPARESLVSGIPAREGKTANLFLQCNGTKATRILGEEVLKQTLKKNPADSTGLFTGQYFIFSIRHNSLFTVISSSFQGLEGLETS